MRLADIVSAPWAITPEMFSEVQGVYARHCRGEKIDIQSVEARVGRPLQNGRPELQVINGTAVIMLDGVLAKRANLFMQISGGTSTQIAGQQFDEAMADPAVRSIILNIDSPGGTVDGTQALADKIFAARGKKPVTAVADGMMCSAAYWIGSAAEKIYIADSTTMVGSIGCVLEHVDTSAADMQQGYRSTKIKAGKYKQMGASGDPLGAAEKDHLQAMVDANYKIFLSAVARNRGEDVDTVQSEMADGRVFLGQEAIDAGLVDGVSTLDQCLAQNSDDEATGGVMLPVASASAGAAPQDQPPKTVGVFPMITIQSVKTDAPDVAAALAEEGRMAGFEQGQKAETQRIAQLDALVDADNKDLIAQYKADGKTTGPEAAYKLTLARKEVNNARLKALESDASLVATTGARPADDKPAAGPTPAQFKAAERYMDEQHALGISVNPAQALAHVTQAGG